MRSDSVLVGKLCAAYEVDIISLFKYTLARKLFTTKGLIVAIRYMSMNVEQAYSIFQSKDQDT